MIVTSPDPTSCLFISPPVVSCLLLQYSDRARTRAKAKQITVSYGSLLVATGSSVRHGRSAAVLDGVKQVNHAFLLFVPSFSRPGDEHTQHATKVARTNGVISPAPPSAFICPTSPPRSQPRRLQGDQESACFCVRHSDLRGPKMDKPDAYGLGSAHYLRDVGDCIKLVKALSTVPAGKGGRAEGGGDANTVVLVGGGLLCMEVAAAIVTHYP